MKKTKILAVFLALLLILAGCAQGETPAADSQSQPSVTATAQADSGETADDDSGEDDLMIVTQAAATDDTVTTQTSGDMFTDRDSRTDYDESESVVITLNGDTASASSDSVKITGSTIVLSEEGSYILRGELANGSVVVNADEKAKIQIVLDNASITSQSSAALYVLSADKVFVTLAAGSENTLANGGEFIAIDDSNIDAAVFSKDDLTFNGAGSLTVVSTAGHGISCKDDLVFTSGSYSVKSGGHGLEANDSVRICEAELAIQAGKDGIHAENDEDADKGFVYIQSGSLNIEAEGDGVSAGAYVKIEGGALDILSGGGSGNGQSQSSGFYGGFFGGGTRQQTSASDESATSMKGIKAQSLIEITGGSFAIDSADDSIHANGSVTISSGSFALASGDDGIHADETLAITGGQIDISKAYEGLEALNVNIADGEISIVAADDGVNAAGGNDQSGFSGRDNGQFGPMGGWGSGGSGSLTISGGRIFIQASGDGLDANGSLLISGGYTVVEGPANGDTATLDFDASGVITGGTFIGSGASGMAQSFTAAENQGVITVNVGSQAAGTKIELSDASGNVLISQTPSLPFAVVILSSPDIEDGQTYTLTVGGSAQQVTAASSGSAGFSGMGGMGGMMPGQGGAAPDQNGGMAPGQGGMGGRGQRP